jgi:hypothetical protein
VLLAVEASAGRLKTVLAEPSVLDTLQQHRLAELNSTGMDPSTGCTSCSTIWQLLEKACGSNSLVWDTGRTFAMISHSAHMCHKRRLQVYHWHGDQQSSW